MDNLPAHKPTGVHRAIERAGARRCPNFNPVEVAFSQLKAHVSKAAARSLDELWSIIADAIEAFPPSDCRNYFAAAGYEPERSEPGQVFSAEVFC